MGGVVWISIHLKVNLINMKHFTGVKWDVIKISTCVPERPWQQQQLGLPEAGSRRPLLNIALIWWLWDTEALGDQASWGISWLSRSKMLLAAELMFCRRQLLVGDDWGNGLRLLRTSAAPLPALPALPVHVGVHLVAVPDFRKAEMVFS